MSVLSIWLANTHAPWQRGSQENTKGLLRQYLYLPKGADLSQPNQNQLNDFEWLLNQRQRKTIDFMMPEDFQAFSKIVAFGCWGQIISTNNTKCVREVQL